jgi:hypothetical protein
MVWDGNLVSNSSRDHLVRNGYAVRHDGMQSLTGTGVTACLTSFVFWRSVIRRRWKWKRNPLIADADQIKRAMR